MLFYAEQYRGVTYVREVIARILESAQLPGDVYNYGSENGLTMLETAQWLAKELKKDITFEDSGKAHNLWMDCSKLKEHGIAFQNTIDSLKQCILDYVL